MARRGKDLHKAYRSLERRLKIKIEKTSALRPQLLLAFPYEFSGQPAEIAIDTEEFTALCPWTGLPDTGRLEVRYVPGKLLLELKSFKYYLLGYRSVGIVQEHAANRILRDLVKALSPRRLEVTLDYRVRGGLHTVVTVRHPAGSGGFDSPGRG